jgi:signal transduction histidine kinase/CheY-like chemotaxis protein
LKDTALKDTTAKDMAPGTAADSQRKRGRLFPKYVALFLAVVILALVPNAILDVWFSYQQQRELQFRIQREQAKSAAEKIGQFLKEIEGQLSWTIQLPVATESEDEWHLDAVRLLRQAPAVTEVLHLDATGRERFRMSRQAMDVIDSLSDFSHDPVFVEAMANKVYYGPVYFVHDSEPYMTVAVAGARPDDGIIVAQVNLKFIWDVVSQIKVGVHGQAYVVDSRGQLIAHPDISLVLRKTDISRLAEVQAARELSLPESSETPTVAVDLAGQKVLTAYARVPQLNWLVFADLPTNEAYAPFYETLLRSSVLLLLGLALAFFAGLFLARRMIVPIRTLSEGAAQIGSGDLTQRIAIRTGDELEALGDQFNRMADRLLESYATLEHKVEERTRQLEIANLAKSRFLATASHDLRQPLHALGLFVAQLRGRTGAADRKRIVAGIEAALSAMNELFSALLDISKLDAGVLTPKVTEFPIAQLLKRIEMTFAGVAREKGLELRIVAAGVWVRSDFILLERIVLNLISNAIRYTASGRVLVGCRRHGELLHIEVWDTGRGIPPDQHQHIFSEFYRLANPDHDQSGLGLGLAIVDRLCRLLKHPIAVRSAVDKGSCFSVALPLVRAPAATVSARAVIPRRFAATDEKLVVVIDDDPLVLEGMGGLIRSWGCSVVTGNTDSAVLDGLARYDEPPNVIISDYHLRDGKTGIEAIARLRLALTAPIPAFLMSGDTNLDPLREAETNGYPLLHKPVEPAALRAMLTQMLKKRPATHTL